MPHEEGDAAVTDRHEADEKLREAFQSLSGTSREEPSREQLEEIWRAVSGDLPAQERRELVDRMARDPALAEAWRTAHELWQAAAQPTAAAEPRGARLWTRSWLAAAAAVLIAVTAGVLFQVSRPPSEDAFRDPGHYVVASLVPPDAILPRDAFRLRWTRGPGDSRYHVRVTTENLRVLTTVSDLSSPELVIGREVLASVAPGARVLWQVDVTLPEGDTVSSETFVVRVQ
jgi:hypothetical protein